MSDEPIQEHMPSDAAFGGCHGVIGRLVKIVEAIDSGVCTGGNGEGKEEPTLRHLHENEPPSSPRDR